MPASLGAPSKHAENVSDSDPRQRVGGPSVADAWLCVDPRPHVAILFRAERSQGDRTRAALREAKKKEREAVAGGKKPFFLKGSEKKRLSLEQRCAILFVSGQLLVFVEDTCSLAACG